MRFFKFTYLILFFFTIAINTYGQDVETTTSDSSTEDVEVVKTLQHQFQYIKDKSNSYQEYKVVKITNLNNFWSNVKDSLEAQKSEHLVVLKEIESQKAVIQKLQKEYDIKEGELQKGDYEKAHITFLGIDFLKQNYIYLNSGLILFLILILGVLYFKYKGSEKEALIKKNNFESIDKELNDHKIKAREKELKIKRELQTEMNKVQELSQELNSLRSRSASQS